MPCTNNTVPRCDGRTLITGVRARSRSSSWVRGTCTGVSLRGNRWFDPAALRVSAAKPVLADCFPARNPRGFPVCALLRKIILNARHTNTNKPMYASAHVGTCEQQSAHSYRNGFTTCAWQHAGWRHKSENPSDSDIPSLGGILFIFFLTPRIIICCCVLTTWMPRVSVTSVVQQIVETLDVKANWII